MTSNENEAYVWIWLPGQAEPVVAGRLSRERDQLLFNYGQSYLKRDDAIAIFEPELPLQAGRIELLPPELDQALNYGPSIGGARPKASLTSEGRKDIAKFSGSTDTGILRRDYLGKKIDGVWPDHPWHPGNGGEVRELRDVGRENPIPVYPTQSDAS